MFDGLTQGCHPVGDILRFHPSFGTDVANTVDVGQVGSVFPSVVDLPRPMFVFIAAGKGASSDSFFVMGGNPSPTVAGEARRRDEASGQ